MAPVTPSRATVIVSSTYEVGGPSTAAIKGPSFPLPTPGLHVPPTMIEDLREQVQVMESQAVQVVSGLKEIETIVQQKCHADEPLAVSLDGLHFDDKLHFVEEPVEIVDREVKRLKRSRIPLVK
nr:putative reverse transcriptase domain-containing protein [Tanacetum cinerariifolium]